MRVEDLPPVLCRRVMALAGGSVGRAGRLPRVQPGVRGRFRCAKCGPDAEPIVGLAPAQRHVDVAHGGGRLEAVL